MKASTPIRQHKTSSPPESARPRELLSPLVAWIVAAALAAAVLAIYSPSLNFQFILDDHRFVADPRVQGSGHLWEYFTTYVWSQVAGGPSSFYRPVFVLWLRLNFILSEASPWGWHLLSILKHLSAAILLGLLVWKLLRDRVAALLASTLFALHPAQTESVAWITVPDPLMSAAVLGTLLLYLTYAERLSSGGRMSQGRAGKKSRKQQPNQPAGSSSAAWIVASAAACLAALMAKETAIVLPLVLFVLALATPCGETAQKPPSKENDRTLGTCLVSPFRQTLPFLAVTVVYLLLRLNALKSQFSARTQQLPWHTVLLSWPAILWFYVKVLFWPVRPRAFADPILAESFSVSGVLLPALGVVCALAALVATCLWMWSKARRELPVQEARAIQRAVVLGLLIVILPILLALNLNALNPGDFLHGRYTYLPLAGLMLLLATAWHLAAPHLATKWRIALLVSAALLAVAFSVFTLQQEAMWKDDLTVFTVAHQFAPDNAPVALNLANANVQVALALDEAGRCGEAIPIFDQAIQQYPQDWFAWAGRGECFFKLSNLLEAEQSLRRASELSHEPRVTEQWQQVRAMMGLPPTPPK